MPSDRLAELQALKEAAVACMQKFNESLGVGEGSKEAWDRLVEQSKKPLGPNDEHVPQGRAV